LVVGRDDARVEGYAGSRSGPAVEANSGDQAVGENEESREDAPGPIEAAEHSDPDQRRAEGSGEDGPPSFECPAQTVGPYRVFARLFHNGDRLVPAVPTTSMGGA